MSRVGVAACLVALGLVAGPAAGADRAAEFPFLDDEPRDQAISVGDTSHGFLVAGKLLEPDATLDILPRQKERGLAHGTHELVALLQHAGRELHRQTGTKLWVGNLSRAGGGDIAWSVSHNSGRDADVALAYRDARGKPVDPPDLLPLVHGIDRQHGYRFDAARTWLVIKALLTHRGAQVQYLFLAGDLRRDVLAHARKTGEPAKLVERASLIVRHPVGAGAHDDHLHVRIYCGERDVLGGCLNLGVLHPGVRLFERERDARAAGLARRLRAGEREPDLRRRLVERLVLLDAHGELPLLATLLEDESAPVRVAAARALATLGGPAEVARLAERARVETDPAVRSALVTAVGDLGGEAAGEFLRLAVGEPTRELSGYVPALGRLLVLREPSPLGLLSPLTRALAGAALVVERERALPPLEALLGEPGLVAALESERVLQGIAVAAAGRAERLEPSAALVELLADRDPSLRAAAEQALARGTNLRLPLVRAGRALRAGEEPTPLEVAEHIGRWRELVRRRRAWPRHAWLSAGFTGAGYGVRTLEPQHAWELVRAVAADDHLSYNAQRVLQRVAKEDAPTLAMAKDDACAYWLRWFKARREQYRLPPPPAAVSRACSAAAHVD